MPTRIKTKIKPGQIHGAVYDDDPDNVTGKLRPGVVASSDATKRIFKGSKVDEEAAQGVVTHGKKGFKKGITGKKYSGGK